MKISRVIAKDLFSWAYLNILFDTDSTYSIVGENGSGKSSMFEIITWVLFKKSSKKNVKSDFGKTNGWGRIELFNGENTICITRKTDKPTEIVLGIEPYTEVIEQEQLDNIIGCNYDTFMASSFISQKRISAFVNEKTDTGKAKIFAEMLGIGILDKARTKISSLKNDREMEYEKAKTKADLLSEQRETCLLKFEDNAPEQYKDNIMKLKEKYKRLKDRGDELQKEYDGKMNLFNEWEVFEKQSRNMKFIKEDKIKRENEIKELESKLSAFKLDDEKIKKVKDNIDKIKELVLSNNHQIKFQSDAISNLKKILNLGGTCPTCGSVIGEKHKKKIKSEMIEFREIVQTYCDKNKELGEKSLKYKSYDQRINDYESLSKQIQIKKGSLTLNKEIEKIELIAPSLPKPDITVFRDKLNENTETIFSYREKVNERIKNYKDFKGAEKLLEQANKSVKILERDYYISKWLFDNIPMIKLMYIDNNKERLETLINKYLSNINMPFMVKIDTQKEMKSTKEIRDEFSFKIIHTEKNCNVDKEDISGGQEVLLLLATQFAINDLINPQLKFEAYDEILSSLDESNIGNVVDMLKDRGINKQVFVISHKPEISNSFQMSLKINMKGSNSYVSS